MIITESVTKVIVTESGTVKVALAGGLPGVAGNSNRALVHLDDDYLMTVDDIDGTQAWTNRDATGTIALSLATTDLLVGGEVFRARVYAAQALRVTARSGATLRYNGIESAADGYLESANPDDVIELEYRGDNSFLVVSAIGEWTFGP